MNKFLKLAGRFLFFVAVTTTATLVFQTASASAAGTIKAGLYCVELRVDGDKVCVPLRDQFVDVKLDPPAPSSSATIDAGKINISNVPAGTYTVTVSFELTKEACSDIVSIIAFSPLGELLDINPVEELLSLRFCDDDGVYRATKIFSGVVVTDGNTTFLGGDNDTDKKILAKAIRVDPATGLPIIECAAEGGALAGVFVDWVVCPALEFTIRAIDLAITYILVPFLAINPLTVTYTNEAGAQEQTELYVIWDNIRNVTNIIFILVFFVMIFWQAIGSVYGVKKILPRLIAMAIAANLSFFICQLLIDFSNILGVGISTLLTTVVIGGQPVMDLSGAVPLIAAAAPAILVSMFIFILIAAVMILVGAIVLIVRQVLLIFLVIVSPVAFAAGVLPNTSRLLSRWFNLFIRLVLMYPIIMLMLSAGRIASHIITSVGAQF